ncbi:hypothetical protein RRG08_065169 [Elysia crispata]|uniref:Uncharacterized protein n=1 Tax=Elysia crispata TaxID=231223 RepID=A0AAE0Z0B0_9GAST|nr:hypothetical protein RRG08_065169 [Elysia crispata]
MDVPFLKIPGPMEEMTSCKASLSKCKLLISTACIYTGYLNARFDKSARHNTQLYNLRRSSRQYKDKQDGKMRKGTQVGERDL